MLLAANILIGIIAIEHACFFVLEALLWTKPAVRRFYTLSKMQAEASRGVAANIGLYNTFLAAGLIWSLLHPASAVALQLKLFFLGCVLAAGLFGVLMSGKVAKRIFLLQALPAIAALTLLLLA